MLPRPLPAIVTIAATAAAFCSTYAVSVRFDAGPNAAILSAVLSLTLARREAHAATRGSRRPAPAWIRIAVFALIGIATATVASLLHRAYLVGAVLFVTLIAVSILSRRFEGRMRTAGAMLALPLVAALIVPPPPRSAAGSWTDLGLIVFAGLVAVGWRLVVVRVATMLGGPAEARPDDPARGDPAGRGSGADPAAARRKLASSTRMAIQSAVALSAAFALGRLLFPGHWGWVVLTTYIVGAGSAGRGETAYKALLRVGGALAGAVVSSGLLVLVPSLHGPAAAAVIFVALFIGVWLRERNYAWWAAAMTLVLALLQPDPTLISDTGSVLLARVLAIVLGAICAVVAAWFILPIRSESVARRRLADTLRALDQLLAADAGVGAAAERAAKQALLDAAQTRLDQVAAPFRLHRRLVPGDPDDDHPAVWAALARDCVLRADRFRGAPAEPLRALRGVLKALRDRDRSVTAGLRGVRRLLEGPPAALAHRSNPAADPAIDSRVSSRLPDHGGSDADAQLQEPKRD